MAKPTNVTPGLNSVRSLKSKCIRPKTPPQAIHDSHALLLVFCILKLYGYAIAHGAERLVQAGRQFGGSQRHTVAASNA